MTIDRNIRLLTSLQRSGSTSRVLNLAAVEREHGREDEHRAAPMFENPLLNSCIIVKHRLRLDELRLFSTGRATVTKIILPFDKRELKLGGRAMMVGQRGWEAALRDLCSDAGRLGTDIALLHLIDRLPSVDPFLLREQLRRHGRKVARCYFALSPGDIARMQAYVGVQLQGLIQRAFAERGGDTGAAVARMVEALLATEADERLAPLRSTLKLEGEAFREGVFSWRGFLYYKWSLNDLWPQLDAAAEGLEALAIIGDAAPGTADYVRSARGQLHKAITRQRLEVSRGLGVYDRAYNRLTREAEPREFVEFLHKAPALFIDIGEAIGVLSHVASYWRYRFPPGTPVRAPAEEAIGILQDFELALGVTTAAAA